mgnify:FL=1
MSEQLVVLLVIVPLITAPLCLILRKPNWVWGMSAVACLLVLIISSVLWHQCDKYGPISYAFGGWEPPWGIEYRIDSLSSFLLVAISLVSFGVISFARKSVEHEITPHKVPQFYAALLLTLTGFLGIVSTADIFNLFVFFEISALSSYALISTGPRRSALIAAYRYFIMGSIGATFLLAGIGFLYLQTGTLNMPDLSSRLATLEVSAATKMAFVFIVVGIGLKMALFPMHVWLPNAYRFAPSTVTIFLAAISSKVAFYVLIRFCFDIFSFEFSFGSMALGYILIPLSLLAMVLGSITAIFQTDIKFMMVYSSVASIGYLVLGVCLLSQLGIQASLIHLFNHALTAAALFMALGCISYQISNHTPLKDSLKLSDLGGLGQRMPYTMAGFLVAGLSLVGAPLTAGFISKWYLILAVLEAEWWSVLPVLVIAMLLALVYVWKVVEVAYFQPINEKISDVQEAPLPLLLPLWVLAAGCIYFGVHSTLVTHTSSQAAKLLLGGSS